MNTKAKNRLTGSCTITLNLPSLNTQSKTYPSGTSSKCEINLTTHECSYENSCSKLNLANFKTRRENNIPKSLRKLVQTYRQILFTRKVGKLKDTKIKLHKNKSIRPVAQAKRRIPFCLRESVRAEIKNLEEQDIMGDVTYESAHWLSQLVIVPTQAITFVLVLTCINAAIERTRFSTLTVDDLMFRLKNGQYFTKLDLSAAFHQLELDK